jgi:AcrR family transcriptional regulator
VPRIINRFSDVEPLSVESIVRAAVVVTDREGLGALTMRRLGRELGVEAMSIYHHISNKAALLELIALGVLADADVDREDLSVVELLEHYGRRLRTSLVAHPASAPILAGSLPATAFASGTPQTAVGLLVDAGFDEYAGRWIIDAFVGFVVGHVLVAASTARPSSQDADATFETGLRFLLAGLRQELGE